MLDIEEITKQVRDVISYSQNIENPKVEELMQNWLKAKQPFIDAFGGKLIWESPTPVSFKLDSKEKNRKVTDFSESVYQTYHNEDLYNFIESNSDSFFDNRVNIPYVYNGKTIPHGMKLVKAFKYFEEDPKALNELQSQASQLIQEDKVEGTLCFSVHPLDFLSSSENTYNWRSCHALDGEYRAGNLSYMGDSSTVICYIKGADDVFIPNFGDVKWNSKKWRVFMFVSEGWDFISPGRQYPFTTTSGIEQVTDLFLQELGKKPYDFEPLTDFSIDQTGDPNKWLFAPHIWVNGRLVCKSDIVKDNGYLHFNDLLRSSCYNMQYRGSKYLNSTPIMRIGSHVKCTCCGRDEISNPETMMCDQCELEFGEGENDVFAYCDCCGARFYREDGIYVGDYDLICPSCYETECFVCESCGEVHYNPEKVYDKEAEEYICAECYEARKEEREEY